LLSFWSAPIGRQARDTSATRIASHATVQTASNAASNIVITMIDGVLSIDTERPEIRDWRVSL